MKDSPTVKLNINIKDERLDSVDGDVTLKMNGRYVITQDGGRFLRRGKVPLSIVHVTKFVQILLSKTVMFIKRGTVMFFGDEFQSGTNHIIVILFF